MHHVSEKNTSLYLEDLHVGQRFTSGSYHMDENRIAQTRGARRQMEAAALAAGRVNLKGRRVSDSGLGI
jgi:hypothetical protein